MKLTAAFMFAGALGPMFAQSGSILVSAGYSSPAPLEAAPGQVVTFFVRGLPPAADGRFRLGQADDVPLPTTLAGISVVILQGQATLQSPIFAVRQESECETDGNVDATCLLTSIRVQIPFELAADVTLTNMGKVIYSQQVKLRFDVDGRPGRPFALQPLPDNGHVLTNCDVSWDTRPESVCNRQVYHADGAPADEKAPAKGGETILVYAYGLGKTTATVATGVLSPPDAVLTDLVGHPRVWAEFQKDFLNALSSTPRMLVYGPTGNDFLPVMFAGLVPGQVGMYQLNIRLPPLASPYPCGGDVHSNAVLTVTTLQGTEGIALCIQP